MLPPVQRFVSTASQSPAFSFLTSTAPRAGFFFALCIRPRLQRKYSSSKPSRTDDGPNEFSTRTSPLSSNQSGGRSKKSSEKRSPYKKNFLPELPSVPSTGHMTPETTGLSTFFSLHRPISVTHSFPQVVTEDKFAEIFSLRATKRGAVADHAANAATLAQAVNDMERTENDSRSLPLDGEALTIGGDQSSGLTRLDLHHADGSETRVLLQLSSMSGQFIPYRPPPIPKPQKHNETGATEASELESADLATEAERAQPQKRVYKAILTIEETVDADGQYRITAHSPQLIEEGSIPRTFLDRMALRQATFDEARRARLAIVLDETQDEAADPVGQVQSFEEAIALSEDAAEVEDGRMEENTMVALSVRRQRKLKMKKKKYKKLMRKTRNERRKLHKL